uniref:hypothetical protein n=1 Tax=Sphingobium yanoikuyae TaxID=13690 RepID=UPI002FDE4C5A
VETYYAETLIPDFPNGLLALLSMKALGGAASDYGCHAVNQEQANHICRQVWADGEDGRTYDHVISLVFADRAQFAGRNKNRVGQLPPDTAMFFWILSSTSHLSPPRGC